MFYKGVILGELGLSEDAVTAFDQVLSWFGDATDPAMAQAALAEPVARAFVGRNTALGKLGRHADAAVFDQGIQVARHLMGSGQPEAALEIVDGLPDEHADYRQRHNIRIVRGNALIGIPGKVKDALAEFECALAGADQLDSPDRLRLVAEARKELGHYFRVIGRWEDAEQWYEDARDAILALLAQRSDEDRRELAAIFTEWGYLRGLNGRYREGLELVESAIAIRRSMQLTADEGLSWTVYGEVHRYACRYETAWGNYSIAERQFRESRSWGRLGLVQQQQAICLVQAAEDGIQLTSEPLGDAKRLISSSLTLCQKFAIRDYPSALNRAGRIYGSDDPLAALNYLRQGITEARLLSDGWFWFANVIEYAQLCYRLWDNTADNKHRVEIASLADEVLTLTEDYSFPDLIGRWRLLQAHLDVDDYARTGDTRYLTSALENYKTGFEQLSRQLIGSSGGVSLRAEFHAFAIDWDKLPSHVRQEWHASLRSAWAVGGSAVLLLARLEELY